MLTPFQRRAVSALGGSPFFGELDESEMRLVSRSSVRKGCLLFEKGDPSRHLFGLVGGRLGLFSRRCDGREVSHGLVAPGELVGQIGAVDGAPRFASAKALEHSELATLERQSLDVLLQGRQALRDSLARATALAARRRAEHAEDAAFLSIEERIEKALVDLAKRFGERVELGVRIPLRQRDLASVVGASRESVSRVLTAEPMRARIKLGRGSIVLLRA
jgi:CRP-like cAMP-binding protein